MTALTWIDHAHAGLRGAGLRNGGARRTVVDFLAAQDCCLSAQEIFDGIRDTGSRVGIASVYRILDTLAELGLVQRVLIGDGVTRYETLPADGHHHHHLVCDDCGRVDPFEDTTLEKALVRVADTHGYRVGPHEVVVHGSCGECRAA